MYFMKKALTRACIQPPISSTCVKDVKWKLYTLILCLDPLNIARLSAEMKMFSHCITQSYRDLWTSIQSLHLQSMVREVSHLGNTLYWRKISPQNLECYFMKELQGRACIQPPINSTYPYAKDVKQKLYTLILCLDPLNIAHLSAEMKMFSHIITLSYRSLLLHIQSLHLRSMVMQDHECGHSKKQTLTPLIVWTYAYGWIIAVHIYSAIMLLVCAWKRLAACIHT